MNEIDTVAIKWPDHEEYHRVSKSRVMWDAENSSKQTIERKSPNKRSHRKCYEGSNQFLACHHISRFDLYKRFLQCLMRKCKLKKIKLPEILLLSSLFQRHSLRQYQWDHSRKSLVNPIKVLASLNF